MSEETDVIALLNEVAEFVEIDDYMKDEHLAEVLGLIVKLISQPDIPASAAIPLVIRLEAMSAKFAMQDRKSVV